MNPCVDLAHAIRSAEGWLDLGLPREAQRELDLLPRETADEPIVQIMRVWIGCSLHAADLPGLAQVHILAARAFSRLGHFEDARFHLAQAVSLQPTKGAEWANQPEFAYVQFSAPCLPARRA